MDNNVDIREIKTEGGRLPIITVVGVGGGGNNTLSHLARTGTFSDIRLMIANTDFQHMQNSPVKHSIVLGKKGSSGHGAGMKPEKGREAAEESYDDIKQALMGSDLVIISAGLGGGTGTGAAPVFARAAKECGALTVAVVTKPFSYEGSKREKLADEGLKELYNDCDSIVVIPNQKLLSVIGKGTGYKESMSYVDDVVARAVNAISSVILNHSDGMNVDFEDLCTIMNHRGLALMGVGEAKGENAAEEAVRDAIESPLFGNMSINGSMGVIVNFEFSPDYPLYVISESMSIIHEAVNNEADIIMGTMMRDEFDTDKVKVSIVATGFERSNADTNRGTEVHDSKTKIISQKPTKPVDTPKIADESTFDSPSVFVHRVRIGNSDYSEDELDTPTYLRHQKD